MAVEEKSLVFIKPEAAMQAAVAAQIIEELLAEKSLVLVAFKRFRASEKLARAHYAEHEGKPFFPKIVSQVLSGPVIAMEFRGEGIVSKIRALAGATMVEKAAPDSIRGKYGIRKGLNVLHASDSPVSGEREVTLWKQEAGLKENASAALREAKAFVKKWKSAGGNTSPAIRVLCSAPLDAVRREKIHEILSQASKGTDVTSKEIENLLNVIDTSSQE